MKVFSVIYDFTALFSLKDSNSTNSGAKTLFLPQPYTIKMALLNQAISVGGDLDILSEKGSKCFKIIRDAKISYHLPHNICFCVNNMFIKILKQKEDKGNNEKKGKAFEDGFQRTVSYREYVHISQPIQIIFEVQDEVSMSYLKKYLHGIPYFGKSGCFIQFLGYNDTPPEPNVTLFDYNTTKKGIIQKFDDFDSSVTFEMVSNLSDKKTKRKQESWLIPVELEESSKAYSKFAMLNE